jgi:cytochrome bd-type quinol oxidase subunit 2
MGEKDCQEGQRGADLSPAAMHELVEHLRTVEPRPPSRADRPGWSPAIRIARIAAVVVGVGGTLWRIIWFVATTRGGVTYTSDWRPVVLIALPIVPLVVAVLSLITDNAAREATIVAVAAALAVIALISLFVSGGPHYLQN